MIALTFLAVSALLFLGPAIRQRIESRSGLSFATPAPERKAASSPARKRSKPKKTAKDPKGNAVPR